MRDRIGGVLDFWARSAICLAVYVLLNFFLEVAGVSLVPGDMYRGVLLGDAVTALIVAPLLWRMTRNGPGWEPDMKSRISPFGWGVLAAVMLFMYVSVEMAGLWIGYLTPTAGATETYTSMSDETLYLYIVRAVTVTPLLEELAARFLIFRPVRAKYGFWPGMILSALYFTAIHGTLMHIPLTIGLTMFNCVLYSVTGKFRYCVGAHILFNWFSTTLVFSIAGFPVWCRFLCLGLSYLSLLCLYVFRDRLFNRVLSVGAIAALESLLNNELDKLADEAEAFGRERGGPVAEGSGDERGDGSGTEPDGG